MKTFVWPLAAIIATGALASVACGNDYTSGNSGTQGGTAPTDPTNDYQTPDDQTASDLEIDPTQENSGGVAYDPGIPIENRVDQNDNPGDYHPDPPGGSSFVSPGPETSVDIGSATGIYDPPLGSAASIVDVLDPDSPPPDDAPKVDAQGRPLWHRNVYNVTIDGQKVQCFGSLYNCEFPNPQYGRRRYLPAAVASEIANDLEPITDASARGDLIHTELEAKGHWAVTGSPPLYDGVGLNRGVVTDQNVRVNFGQRKRINGVLNVYAWSVNLKASDGVSYVASGWIPQSNVVSTELTAMPTVTPPIPKAGYKFATSAKTGKAIYYTLKTADDYGCAQGFLPQTCLPTWATHLDVAPDSRAASNGALYFFMREGEVTNLMFQTPWAGTAATDTFGASAAVTFRRLAPSAHHATLLRIPLFAPGKHRVLGGITFVYGLMNGRWGWMNWFALKVTAGPDDTGCTGKAPNTQYCEPDKPTNVLVCSPDGDEDDAVCPLSQHCREGDPVTHAAALDSNGDVICDPD